MTTPAPTGTWTENGGALLSQPILNFFARRRIAISLIGFLSLAFYNLFVRKTVPLNPLNFTDVRTGAAILLIAIGLGIRSWSAGTLNKSREVTRHGPYALTRNPLYVGSFLMMFAFCILLQDLLLFLFVAGPMVGLYWLQVRFEEKRLLHLFPNDWPSYCSEVPRFVPKRIPSEAFRGWTKFEWLRNREYKTILASLVGIAGIYAWHVVAPMIWS